MSSAGTARCLATGLGLTTLAIFYICISRSSLVPRGATPHIHLVGQLNQAGIGQTQPRLIGALGACPRATAVVPQCVTHCTKDTDCPAATKCCFNGCGSDCVPASNSANPIRPPIAIQPLLVSSRPSVSYLAPGVSPPHVNGTYSRIAKPVESVSSQEKPGQCPSLRRRLSTNTECHKECNTDRDCSGVNKCCSQGDGDCGRVCLPPEKAGGCIHLLSSVDRLPLKQFANGYVPSCSAEGSFNPVQCDNAHCWCVEVESGREILGTKMERSRRALVNCKAPSQCPEGKCSSSSPNDQCPTFGYATDERGCPMEDCRCKSLCEGLKCSNKLDECQLVEPDCASPPCSPVPRCKPSC